MVGAEDDLREDFAWALSIGGLVLAVYGSCTPLIEKILLHEHRTQL